MNTKNYKNLIDENYEDALFAKLMDEHAQIEGSRLLEENEQLMNDHDSQLSYGLNERCMCAINGVFKTQRREERHKRQTTVLRRVAVVMLTCVTLFTGLMCTASAFRESVFRLFATEFKEKTDIQIRDVTEIIPTNEEISEPMYELPEGIILPTWLPKGYVLTSLSCDDNQLKATYTSGSGNQILYKEFSDNFSAGIDTENADDFATVLINEYTGLIVAKGKELSVNWGNTDRRVIIRISSKTISKDDILQMARSVAQ